MKVEKKHPIGAIKSREVLADILAESRQHRSSIKLYCVNSCGASSSISPFLITPNTKLVEGRGTRGDLFIDGSTSLLDMNIGENHYNDTFVFDHRMHAENYLNRIKVDDKHIEAFNRHLDETQYLDSLLDSINDEDDDLD